MKKILITGGAGFIGYHLACHLLNTTEAELTLVDNLQRGVLDDAMRELLANKRVKFLKLDLSLPASYQELGGGYDHVYHLAAVNGTRIFYEQPHEVLRVNTLSMFYILDWMQRENREGKLCFTSSNEAYAGGLIAFKSMPLPTPESVPLVIENTYNPRWSYAGSKLLGELAVIHFANAYHLRSVIVRPHNFYGPRAGYDHVIPDFSLRIAAHTDPFPVYGGEETRTFCYIDDAVRAMSLLMDSSKTDGLPAETFHIGGKDEVRILDLAEEMFRITNWHPKQLDVSAAPKGSVGRRLGDISKIKTAVGWEPEVSLEAGLKKTYDWYLEHPKPSSV